MLRLIFMYITLLAIVGCTSIGPSRVHMDRATYNNVVQQTEQEQFLMNIVRSRYLEILQYIQIGSLTASYSLSESLAGNVTGTTTIPRVLTSSLSPTVYYSDTPTISYTPLSNSEFAKSLMTPVTMADFILLARAGKYDNMMLFYVLIEQIGDVNSDLLHFNGIDHITPQFVRFNHEVALFRTLFKTGAFEAPRAITFQNKLGGLFTFHKNYEKSPKALKLKKLLGIASDSKNIIFLDHPLIDTLEDKNDYLVQTDIKTNFKNVVYVRLRSVYALLSMLGRGVQIPCRDINAHKTRELVIPDGSRYDWTNKMRSIFTVYSSEKEPRKDVLVKVFHHNYWFYIKTTDQTSKDTFDAAIRLYTLTSALAANNNNAPLLTIPVAASSVMTH